MKSGEKLILLLELNGFDVTKMRMKKQLEYDKDGNLGVYRSNRFVDILQQHYQFSKGENILYKNPLNYCNSWKKTAKSIDQFYVNHPDVPRGMTLKEFLNNNQMGKKERDIVLHEIVDDWMADAKHVQESKVNALSGLVNEMQEETSQYQRPGRFLLVLSLILALVLAFFIFAPEFMNISTITNMIPYANDYINLTRSYTWFFYIGFGAIVLFALYVINNIWYSLVLRSRQTFHSDRLFEKYYKDVEYQQFQQLKALNKYVKLIVKKPHKSTHKITPLLSPNKLSDSLKMSIEKYTKKYDSMVRHYDARMKFIRWNFLLGLFVLIAFLALGYGLIGGYINV